MPATAEPALAAALATVTFGEHSALETIGVHAFRETGLKSVAIPDKVTSIGDYAFAWALALETLDVDELRRARVVRVAPRRRRAPLAAPRLGRRGGGVPWRRNGVRLCLRRVVRLVRRGSTGTGSRCARTSPPPSTTTTRGFTSGRNTTGDSYI